MPSLLDPDDDPTLGQTGAGLLRIGQDDGSDQGAALADLYRRVSDYMDQPQQADVTPRWDPSNPVGTETTQALRQATPIVSPERYQAHQQVQQAMDLAPTIALGMLGDAPGIRGYHGSGADFNRFSDDFIGTGEGAQSYGYGHYVAGQEAVGQNYNVASKDWYDATNARLTDLARQMDQYRGGEYGKFNDPKGYDLKAQYDALMSEKANKTGHMYEVNIAADPAHFLDWDKPLDPDSQQIPFDKMRRAGLLTGNTLEDQMRRELFQRQNAQQLDEGPALQRWHEELGTAAKTADDAALDHIWDQQNIIQKWWDEGTAGQTTGGTPTGQTAVRQLAERLGSPEKAAQALRDAGIPGIRYLDAGSRAAGQGTSNHVVFDPATIEILRKYGIAGLGLGLGAAATQQGNGQ